MYQHNTLLVTSIAPGNLENQKKAVQSWLDLGFSVFSLNTEQEINQLSSIYEEINFHQVNRDAKDDCGKPVVYIEDILDFLKFSNVDICGIINSDIQLRCSEDILKFMLDNSQNAMVVACRIDIDEVDSKTGIMYWGGYDLFLFNKNIIEYLPYQKAKFCLGQPWWDYWLPLICLQNKNKHIPVKFLAKPIAYHVKHDVKWDNQLNYEKYGLHFMQYFVPYNFYLKLIEWSDEEIRQFLGDSCRQIQARIMFDNASEWISC